MPIPDVLYCILTHKTKLHWQQATNIKLLNEVPQSLTSAAFPSKILSCRVALLVSIHKRGEEHDEGDLKFTLSSKKSI